MVREQAVIYLTYIDDSPRIKVLIVLLFIFALLAYLVCRPKPRDGMCPICLITFAENATVCVLPCRAKHEFHEECAIKWLSQNEKKVCPLDREEISNKKLRKFIKRLGKAK